MFTATGEYDGIEHQIGDTWNVTEGDRATCMECSCLSAEEGGLTCHSHFNQCDLECDVRRNMLCIVLLFYSFFTTLHSIANEVIK